MPEAPNVRTTMILPPDETIRVWQEREALRPTVNWSEMMHEAHASAFTVAKVAQLDLLRSIRGSLDDIIRNGGTFEQWRDTLMPELRRHGWWGVVRNEALTGTPEAVVVNDRRLRNIYRTNIRMSLASARWRRIQREKNTFPYLRYRSDHFRKHPRLDHQSWHGLILPADDPWWLTHFPPNGWGCNCKPEQVSERMLRRHGWKVGTAPTEASRPFQTATGEVIQVPEGIDPGFGYNPGIAHLQAVALRAARSITEAARTMPVAARQTLTELVADPAFEQFMVQPNLNFPMIVMGNAEQAAIGARGSLAYLSSDSLQKQLRNHPDLAINDYRRIPNGTATARHRLRQSARRLIYLFEEDGRWWRVAVKVTRDGEELFVVSYHRLSASEAERLARQFPEISE